MISFQTPIETIRPPSGKCLGAVFCSYAFDEGFFSSVLAAVLPIHADPESDARFFLMEARRRLRETPVVVLTDGNSYSGGHQLPFDLLLSPKNVAFQARLAILLFENHARLVVGSANLTPTGFGESADLAAVLHLDYHEDGWLLNEALAILESAGARGEGWDRFQKQCRAMLGPVGRSLASPRLLATQEGSSVLEQFLAGIPKIGKARDVHIIVPTQPEDDARSGTNVLVPLHDWMKTRGKNVRPNIAIAWADASVTPSVIRQITEPEQLAGYLVAEKQGPPGAETVCWHSVERIEGSKVYIENQKSPLPRKAMASVMQSEPPRAWAVEEVTGAGLLEAIEPFAEAPDPSWWLFPEVQLQQGRIRRRPFHAKLIGVCTIEKSKPVTHVLLGCPNFERKLSKAESNFEIGLHLRLEGHVSITELCPQLVPAPTEGFFLEDRSWLPADLRIRSPLERAIYDAQSHKLKLEWRPRAPECRLSYQRESGEEELFKGRPGLHTSISSFVLAHSCAELRVWWEDRHELVPILVSNTPYLRADEPEHSLTLKELVALYANQRRVAKADRRLTAQDVFAAQNALVETLLSTGTSLSAFDVAVDGPVGLRVYVDCLLKSEDCEAGEAWLFGLELCKLLLNLKWRGDPFAADKKRVIDGILKDFQSRLSSLNPNESWSVDVAKYFGGDA